MFIPIYLTIFVILFYYQTFGAKNVSGYDASDNGWGLYLSVSQGNDEYPSYNIGHWTRELHLQQCAFVEIGEEFCALFVELRNIPSVAKIPDSSGVGEFFLGLCECATVRSWILCSDQLMRRRKSDCVFTEAIPTTNTSARVHRRLCDVTLLTKYARPCNCSIPMANQQLHRTQGFPTCFRSPLPESICSPRGVCGIARCCATTIKGIHSPQCDPECHEKQPFCEELGPWTSIPPEITSLWSHWSTPVCENNGGRVFSTATAICLNQVTGKPAIDCIGPGSFCCPADIERCTCIVTNENGILKATRIIESKPCVLDFERDGATYFKHRSQREKNNAERYDEASDHFYRDASQKRMEYRSHTENLRNPWRRRLMFSSYDYSEGRDRYFDKRGELSRADNVPVNEDEGDDSSDDNGDEKEDDKNEEKNDEKPDDNSDDNADDSNDDDDDDNSDDDITFEGGEGNADEDANEDDNDESSDDDEDSAESSEFSDYVVSDRDENVKNSEVEWIGERSARFVRSNPRKGAYLRKRKDKRGFLIDTNDECEQEKESTNIEGLLIYSDYDSDSSDSEDDKETSGEDYDGEASSLAVIGRVLKSCPYYCLSTYTCIVSIYLI